MPTGWVRPSSLRAFQKSFWAAPSRLPTINVFSFKHPEIFMATFREQDVLFARTHATKRVKANRKRVTKE